MLIDPKKKERFVLFLGLGFVSACLGYITGASATPVVGVIIPAIFGLVTLAFAVISSNELKSQIALLAEQLNISETEQPSLSKLLSTLDYERGKKTFLGIAMVVFSFFYVLGSVVGGVARTHEWFAPRPVQKVNFLPWEDDDIKEPETLSDAVDWIELQESLKALGYNSTQIKSLYLMHVEELSAVSKDQKPFSFTLPGLTPKIPELTESPGNTLVPETAVSNAPPLAQNNSLSPSIRSPSDTCTCP